MSAVKTFEDNNQLAIAVAKATTDILWSAINQYDQATWVLAGGMTPLLAYQVIASQYQSALDWTKVTILIGDERIGALNGPTNNWFAIERILFTLPARKVRPKSDLTAEEAAADYERQLDLLPKTDNGLPRLDLVWLGVGDDGHTLSVFPNHSSLYPSGKLVIPVRNSPKPPSDRISLSLRALQGANNAIVIASGAEKNPAVQGALAGNNSPIALATSIIETHGGNVTWFLNTETSTD
jgi:6-phosphogluconolactonase